MATKKTQDKNTKTVDQKWDETLATKESQEMLQQMANDALKQFDLGQCTPMFEDKK